MGDIALRVQNLSKVYTLGATKPRHDTLRDQIAHGLKRLVGGKRLRPTPAPLCARTTVLSHGPP